LKIINLPQPKCSCCAAKELKNQPAAASESDKDSTLFCKILATINREGNKGNNQRGGNKSNNQLRRQQKQQSTAAATKATTNRGGDKGNNQPRRQQRQQSTQRQQRQQSTTAATKATINHGGNKGNSQPQWQQRQCNTIRLGGRRMWAGLYHTCFYHTPSTYLAVSFLLGPTSNRTIGP